MIPKHLPRFGMIAMLGGCSSAPLIRVDLAGYAPGQPVPILVFAAHDPGALSLDGARPTTLTAADDPGLYPAAGGDLRVWSYLADGLDGGSWTASVKRASAPLTVSEDATSAVLSMGWQFYAAQRCGAGADTLHGACHLYGSVTDGDPATSSGDGLLVLPSSTVDVCRISAGELSDGTHPPVDVEGGWHDAGDYVKFTHTTAFTVALLLGSYLRDPAAWPDSDGDGSPDVLTAMEPGVRWLIAAHPDDDTLIYQVSDERDHDYWRLPEDDTWSPIGGLTQRPAYACGEACANIAGRSAAALAMAAQAWAGRDDLLARSASTAAVSLYALGLARPGVQPTCPADFYPEDTWTDDMQLAAAALYRLTADSAYLDAATRWSADAGDTEGPPSYADVQVLADAWLAPSVPDRAVLATRAAAVRAAFSASADSDPTGWAGEGQWGSVATAAGYANACAWLVDIDGDSSCGDLSRWQVHAALGMNPYGVPWMVGISASGPLAISSPLTDVGGQPEIGAVVGGPASEATMQEGGIAAPEDDPFADLQTSEMVYHDSVDDYVSNEAALDYTAQLLAAVAAWGARPPN